MYELVETARGAVVAPSRHASLPEGIEALAERAGAVLRRPGARALAQRPRAVVVLGRDGVITNLVLRRLPTS